jgi:hypothetical protein
MGAKGIGESQYVPNWVKKDESRFPRARLLEPSTGSTRLGNTLSPFSKETLAHDTKAFCRLMEHLKHIDGQHGTVLMVQVQNEVGLIGDSRDRHQDSEDLYNASVPKHLLEHISSQYESFTPYFRQNYPDLGGKQFQPKANWGQAFGHGLNTDELFMAYHFASYLEHVSAAGKAIYDIPMFTNAWLRAQLGHDSGPVPATLFTGGHKPGVYPSGGPIETVLDIWQFCAPTFEFLAPDIYHAQYEHLCNAWQHKGQPFFIPEQRHDLYGAIRLWYAIGTHGAMGVSPFGLDSDHPSTSPFTKHYALLRDVSGLILDARANGRKTFGFFFDQYDPGTKDPSPSSWDTTIAGWDIKVQREPCFGHPGIAAFGLILHLRENRFLLVGEGYTAKFVSTDPSSKFNGVLEFLEKKVVDYEKGEMRTLRILNGDEAVGNCFKMPSADVNVRGDGQVLIFVAAGTSIAEAEPFYVR